MVLAVTALRPALTATLIITSGELYLHVSCTTPVGGTATATAATVCTGSGTTITLTGYTGTIQWYSSTDGSTYSIVSGQTSATLSTGSLTQKTWYQATVTSGVCGSANSSVATVDVSPTSVGGTATATLTTVCTGSGTTITLTGYTGTIQWFSSTDGSTYSIVSGQTSATLSIGSLTQKTWYQATVTSGVCSPANSSVATVDVSPTSVGGTATATLTTVCSGSGTTITLTGLYRHDPVVLVHRWQHLQYCERSNERDVEHRQPDAEDMVSRDRDQRRLLLGQFLGGDGGCESDLGGWHGHGNAYDGLHR